MQKYLYDGKLTESLTQVAASDLITNTIFNIEVHGYPFVLHVHDELIAEVPEGFGSIKELCELMCRLPPWADGLPLKAEGWRGKRYRKQVVKLGRLRSGDLLAILGFVSRRTLPPQQQQPNAAFNLRLRIIVEKEGQSSRSPASKSDCMP